MEMASVHLLLYDYRGRDWVLLLQLLYKSIWIAAVYTPLWLQGDVSAVTTLFAVAFASYIVGDLVAIPFAHLYRTYKKEAQR
jgi:hypothetical protein